jgi:hypothetical protein
MGGVDQGPPADACRAYFFPGEGSGEGLARGGAGFEASSSPPKKQSPRKRKELLKERFLSSESLPSLFRKLPWRSESLPKFS